MILAGLLHPLEPGENVTLLCRSRKSSSRPAVFFKDQEVIGSDPSGLMSLVHVSSSDEGQYWCRIRGDGDSPPSDLLVRGNAEARALTQPMTPDP